MALHMVYYQKFICEAFFKYIICQSFIVCLSFDFNMLKSTKINHQIILICWNSDLVPDVQSEF